MNNALRLVILLATFLSACTGNPPASSVADMIVEQCRQSAQNAATDPLTYKCIGDARLDQGDREAAIEAYLAYLAKEPADYAVRLQLAELLIETGRYEQAQMHLEQLTDSHASNADVFFLLGEAHRLAGHCDPALRAYQDALRHSPGLYPAQQGLAQTKNETCGTRYQSENKEPVILHNKPQGGGAALREDQW